MTKSQVTEPTTMKLKRTLKGLTKLSLMALCGVHLSACSVYKSNMPCKKGKGYGCKSMSEVNHLIDLQESGLHEQSKDWVELPKEGGTQKAKPPITKQALANLPAFGDLKGIPEAEEPIYRKAEETMRVWIAPYKNQSGDYVDGFYLHLVTRPGAWEHL